MSATAADLAIIRLKVDEGFRSTMYLDTMGHRTIGYGFCLDAGITQGAATALLTAQTQELATSLQAYAWARALDDARLSVIIQLAFNLGLVGLLHFVKLLHALDTKDWQGAHDALLDSLAAHQLPSRYNSLAQILFTG